jgi:hypothetical protein
MVRELVNHLFIDLQAFRDNWLTNWQKNCANAKLREYLLSPLTCTTRGFVHNNRGVVVVGVSPISADNNGCSIGRDRATPAVLDRTPANHFWQYLNAAAMPASYHAPA